MADIVAKYAFLSWLRRGAAAQIAEHESDGVTAPRARVPVNVGFNQGAITASVTLDLVGAGEVTGLDPRTVIRTWPRANVFDAEPNYFPLIEFDQPDLPWRFTPAHAETSDRLRPWIALVVTEDGEATFSPARDNGALPTLAVDSAASLPDLSQAFAWAHAQVAGETDVSAQRLQQLLEQEPWRVGSRILCPRQLKPNTKYDACLVPALARGRLGGLRLPVPDTIGGLDAAWQTDQEGVLLPVLFHWQFQTGDSGDFESLVRRLEPRVLPATVGIRDMDVSNPGGALAGVPANDRPLGLEGALKSVATQSTPWPPTPTRTRFVDRLSALLNLPALLLTGSTPVRAVAPPLYGRWHAAADQLTPGALPNWFNDLNQDPRTRVTSGLGTQVVRQEQRSLMAAAWQQVEGIRRINEELRLAQLAREIAQRLHVRHLVTGAVEDVVRVTTAVHARVKASQVTIRAVLQRSPVPSAVVDPQFQRVTRPLGPLGRRQGRPASVVPSTLLARINTGALALAPPPATPVTLPTVGRLAANVVPTAQELPFPGIRRLPPWFIALLLVVIAAMILALGPFGVVAAIVVALAAWLLARSRVRDLLEAIGAALRGDDPRKNGEELADAVREHGFTSDETAKALPRADFRLQHAPVLGAPPPAPAPPGPGRSDNADARMFRVAAAEMLRDGEREPAPAPVLVSATLPALSATLIAALEPRVTIAAAVRGRLVLNTTVVWQPVDPIEPVMAYPVFDRPMYEPLRDLGQDFLLPGLEQIPVDTVALLETNQAFVEAYMVGLNHEMSRELLWNEYPTDQRGSYFRQFWDVRGAEAPPGQPLNLEQLKDIREIHRWDRANRLGQNSPRPPLPANAERLVLLVRGALLQRYPNTEIYALAAVAGTGRLRNLGTERKTPIFRGTLRPDLTFFGFDLTPEEAVGDPDPSRPGATQGWFFVLEEQSSEPKFGLDVATDFGVAVADFNNVSWGSLAASAADLSAIRYIDLDAQLPDTRPITDPSAPAWHAASGLGRAGTKSADLGAITLQRPVRIAVHGSDMLRGMT